MSQKTESKVIESGKQVLEIEALSISRLIEHMDEQFEIAVRLIVECKGRVVITGMGKPGFIARKMAATFASTGTPSLFLHPAEAIHGDLGMVTREDIVIAISNSGETEEITGLLAHLKKIGAKIIALTGNLESTLSEHSDVILNIEIDKEACPLGLAPTASTTAALAMGDALAVTVYESKGFKSEDFAALHPGGSLGRKLLKVKDIMRKNAENPVVQEDITVQEALLVITQSRAGSCAICDKEGKLLGIFTDGDLRRHLEQEGADILRKRIADVATKQPLAISEDGLAAEALQILRDRKIDELPVIDAAEKVVGLLDVQDLLKAGFV